MRAFIPQERISNPNPFSGNKTFAGDNRKEYQANASTYRTEQRMKADFDNKSMSLLNNNASGSTGYDKNGKINETSASASAGTVKANTADFENAAGKPSSAVISFSTEASNKLVDGAPAINADLTISISPQKDGSFNFSITGATDGFPAYELWVQDADKGSAYLLLGSNPIESGNSPMALFPPEDQQYNYSGNSKNVLTALVVKFSDTKNTKQKDKN